MKIVIDIPEEDYKKIIEYGECDYLEVITAIENGTPLLEVIETIETEASWYCFDEWGNETAAWSAIKEILERHIRKEKE